MNELIDHSVTTSACEAEHQPLMLRESPIARLMSCTRDCAAFLANTTTSEASANSRNFRQPALRHNYQLAIFFTSGTHANLSQRRTVHEVVMGRIRVAFGFGFYPAPLGGTVLSGCSCVRRSFRPCFPKIVSMVINHVREFHKIYNFDALI